MCSMFAAMVSSSWSLHLPDCVRAKQFFVNGSGLHDFVVPVNTFFSVSICKQLDDGNTLSIIAENS